MFGGSRFIQQMSMGNILWIRVWVLFCFSFLMDRIDHIHVPVFKQQFLWYFFFVWNRIKNTDTIRIEINNYNMFAIIHQIDGRQMFTLVSSVRLNTKHQTLFVVSKLSLGQQLFNWHHLIDMKCNAQTKWMTIEKKKKQTLIRCCLVYILGLIIWQFQIVSMCMFEHKMRDFHISDI